jgi:uncharacterized membrane protein
VSVPTPNLDLTRAKVPSTPIAGPYGHPLHPLFVTLPIGAWITALVLDVGSRAAGDPTGLSRAAWWVLVTGLVGAGVASTFGLLDWSRIPRGTKAWATGLAHLLLNTVTAGLVLASVIVRADQGITATTQTGRLALALLVLGLVVLSVSGWLGGRLSYRYGVRVADEAAQLEGFIDRRSLERSRASAHP